MIKRMCLVWLIAVSLMVCPVWGAKNDSGNQVFGSASAQLRQELEDTRRQLYGGWPSDAPVGLALLVSDGREEIFLTSHLPEDVTADSHYRIASMTKNFTSAAALLLMQEGKLRLDDVVTSPMPGREEPYLPATPEFALPHKEKITIRQLLQHNAAVYDLVNDVIKTKEPVPYANRDYTVWRMEQDFLHRFTVDEMIGVQARFHLAYGKPGDVGYYSNMGYALLSLIVERVSGMDFSEFVRTRLLLPNGLQDTSLPTAGAQRTLPEPCIRGYRLSDGKAVDATNRNPSIFIGSGNMVSTPHDMVRWLRRLNGGKSKVTPKSVAMMRDCGGGEYGLGTMRFKGRAYGHNGTFNGYFVCHYYDTKTGLSWVLVSNAVISPMSQQIKILEAFQLKMLALYESQSK